MSSPGIRSRLAPEIPPVPVMTWTPIRSGGSGERAGVFAIDFAVGRREAGFRDLVGNLPEGGGCFLSKFSGDGLAHLVTAASPDPELLRHETARWAEQARELAGQPTAILSFCAAASLACLVADALAWCGPCPAVVLIDPLVVTPDVLLIRFVEGMDGLTGLVPPDRRAVVVDEAAEGTRAAGADLRATADLLARSYEDTVHRACAENGLDREPARQLSQHFAGVLHYQVCTATVPPDDVFRSSVGRITHVLVSDDHEVPEPLADGARRFGVSHKELLADPGVAAVVASAMGVQA